MRGKATGILGGRGELVGETLEEYDQHTLKRGNTRKRRKKDRKEDLE